MYTQSISIDRAVTKRLPLSSPLSCTTTLPLGLLSSGEPEGVWIADVILGCSCVALYPVRASVVAPVSINVKALQVVVKAGLSILDWTWGLDYGLNNHEIWTLPKEN